MAAVNIITNDILAQALAPASAAERDSSIITPAPDHADQDPLQALVPQALPQDVTAPDAALPSHNSARTPACDLTLDAIVGASVDPAPTASKQTLSTPVKAGPGLRLPSFELLGIANRVSDTAPPRSTHTPLVTRQRNSDPAPFDGSLTSTHPPHPHPSATRRSLLVQHQNHLIETLTPPEEKHAILWNALTVDNFAMDTPAEPSLAIGAASGQTSNEASGSAGDGPVPRIELSRSESDYVRSSWLEDASQLIVSNMRKAKQEPTPTKILSHALPCPSPSGFSFPYIISSLQTQTPGSALTWISVFHALPGKISLSDLPTSPPSTPGPPVGGDDYFTSQTFDSAVQVLDYQDAFTNLPRTPHPVVPPATIGVSIVERYIPPTSANEFSEMFDVNSGRSLLVDRLIELSPDDGTLLFIYPTKNGAETFMRHYLGPIIDPLLRSMRTLHGLPVDLASSLGSMPAVKAMSDFSTLKASITSLCEALSDDGRSSSVRRFSGGKTPRYELELAQASSVKLEREVWAVNWWTKQEKTRVRETVGKYFRLGNRPTEALDITPTNLIHAILDGVASRPYPRGAAPDAEVEIGVFVIKRTA